MRATNLTATLLSLIALPLGAADTYQSVHNPDNRRPMLGVEMTPVPISVQEAQSLAPNQGVYVQSVFNGTAAQTMGLQSGDVILAINGAAIGSMTDLRNEVSLNQVGDPVEVTVQRHGDQVTSTGQYQPWPNNIPYEPIDPAMEQRFREWQDRRLARTRDELDGLSKQISNLRNQLAEPDNAAAGAMGIAMDPLTAAAEKSVAWRFTWRTAAPAGADTVAATVPAAAAPTTARAWRFAWRVGNQLHTQEPL